MKSTSDEQNNVVNHVAIPATEIKLRYSVFAATELNDKHVLNKYRLRQIQSIDYGMEYLRVDLDMSKSQ